MERRYRRGRGVAPRGVFFGGGELLERKGRRALSLSEGGEG